MHARRCTHSRAHTHRHTYTLLIYSTHTFTRACKHRCTHSRACTHTRTHTRHLYTHSHVLAHTCTCTHYTPTLYTHSQMLAHTCMHTPVHAHIHAHTSQPTLYVHSQMLAHICTRSHAHIHAHTYYAPPLHTHLHTLAHICMHTLIYGHTHSPSQLEGRHGGLLEPQRVPSPSAVIDKKGPSQGHFKSLLTSRAQHAGGQAPPRQPPSRNGTRGSSLSPPSHSQSVRKPPYNQG